MHYENIGILNLYTVTLSPQDIYSLMYIMEYVFQLVK